MINELTLCDSFCSFILICIPWRTTAICRRRGNRSSSSWLSFSFTFLRNLWLVLIPLILLHVSPLILTKNRGKFLSLRARAWISIFLTWLLIQNLAPCSWRNSIISFIWIFESFIYLCFPFVSLIDAFLRTICLCLSCWFSQSRRRSCLALLWLITHI